MKDLTLVRTIISAVVQGVIQRFSGTGRDGEEFKSRELLQHYGFTSRPKQGAEGIALIQGNTIYLIAEDDRRYRIALESGEVALYTDEGDKVHLKRGNEIQIATSGRVSIEAATEVVIDTAEATITASGQVTVNAPVVSIEGAATVEVNAPAVTLQAATSIAITAPITTIQGNLQVNGAIGSTGSITLTTGTVTNSNGDVLHHH